MMEAFIQKISCFFGLHSGYIENGKLRCRHCDWVSD